MLEVSPADPFPCCFATLTPVSTLPTWCSFKDIANQLRGGDMAIDFDQIFAKAPHSGGSAFQWHQDQGERHPLAPLFQGTADVGVWIGRGLGGTPPRLRFLSLFHGFEGHLRVQATPISNNMCRKDSGDVPRRPCRGLRSHPAFHQRTGHEWMLMPRRPRAGWPSLTPPWRTAACATCQAATRRRSCAHTSQVKGRLQAAGFGQQGCMALNSAALSAACKACKCRLLSTNPGATPPATQCMRLST